jgi:hypothetical protein
VTNEWVTISKVPEAQQFKEAFMERGSSKKGPFTDDEMKGEVENLERSSKEGHVEEERERETDTREPRIQGSGSSAPEHTYEDWGEVGGESHPKPKGGDEP